ARWCALADAVLIGYADYTQRITNHKPGNFQVNVVVDEAFRRRGVGSMLYQRLIDDLAEHKPEILRADAYENLSAGLPFALKLGFKDVFREGPSHLDIETFRADVFAPLLVKLEDEGIEFISLSAWQKQDADFAVKLFAAYCDAWEDVPKEEESPISWEDWQEWTLTKPQVDHNAYTLAVQGEDIVGFCEMGKAPEGLSLYAGLAGVARSHRNKGIATALYVRAIGAARQHGHPQIQTSSAIENIAMQTVYSNLGFVREPAWIQLEKRLKYGSLVIRQNL
ncbi:GNAT family N-acetyltransferase, partial [Candidatus Bipolaricaulota bacterium]|nr:GNAT family N-acetyltransferase [Candidatus Bipolaricaulota bacterium]